MPPDPTPPVPIAALFTFTNGGTGDLTVQFDQPLQPGPTAAANWVYHHPDAGLFVGPAAGVVAGDTVTIARTLMVPGPDPPTRCDYLAGPADVLGLTGIPAAAFSDFPTPFV